MFGLGLHTESPQPVPHPLLPARGLSALLGQGVPLCVLVPVVWGVPCCCVWGSPPVPLLSDVVMRCWVGGTPPPFPPSAAARVKRM